MKKSFLKTVNHYREKKYIPVLNTFHERLRRLSSGQKRRFTDLANSEGSGSNPFEANFL